MVGFTEGRRAGEFIVSEANGALSREALNVKSGEVLTDGMCVKLDTGQLAQATAGSGVIGIVIGNWDASDGAVGPAPYIARLAEVQDDLVTYPEESSEDAGTQEAAAKTALLAKFVQVR